MSHAQLSPCSNCGDLHPPDSLTIFEGSHLCPTCLARETVICHSRGDRIWVENDAGDSHTHLCESCRSDYYRCTSCGRLIHEDDACYPEDSDDPYCGSCIENVDTRTIHSYNYKPEPLFFGDGSRYFGVELEIVTEPMSLDYHLSKMPWLEVCEKAIALGYRSHQTGTCGLHVHVSRKAFGETREEQDIAIARVLYFVEAHWNELLKFSRRTPRQLEQWAARYGYKEHSGEMLEMVKKNCASRYACVNLINYSTIEFRIFRGTFKLNTIIATLQLVNRVCDVAIHLNKLAVACEVRGTDATGIAYNYGGELKVYKRPLPARFMHFRVPSDVRCVMGHTRMTTQGDEKRNYNNHPFLGQADTQFALAHNGILYNDKELRVTKKLPATKIETDNFYAVRGSNPFCLCYWKRYNLYVYASTEEILLEALRASRLNLGEHRHISLINGDLLHIDASGKRTFARFSPETYSSVWHFKPRTPYNVPYSLPWAKSEYVEEIKSVAGAFGYSPDYIDLLLDEGFTPEEVEELLYEGEL